MQTRNIKLEQIHIPDPCHADWNAMSGDGQKRFCESCSKHVHDLSTLTRSAAERLIAGGNVCIRLTLDPAGRPVTRPRPWWQPARWAAAIAMALGGAMTMAGCDRATESVRTVGRMVAPRMFPASPILGAIASIAPPANNCNTATTGEPIAMPGMMPVQQAAPPPRILAGKPAVIAPRVLQGDIAALPPASQPATQPVEQGDE